MHITYNAAFGYLRSTHEFVVVFAYKNKKLHCMTDSGEIICDIQDVLFSIHATD